ncbi:MAG: translation initiation factor IF-2 [Prevotellaceae bacterium]|jgi:translation initiation factor IF-2|nr:translation initiation factor IF-2 [Prevotellaceae bacterium]
MSVRLSKVTKELNVGLATVVEFLHKNGFRDVTADPNLKISDEAFGLLDAAFNKDKALRVESVRLSQEWHTKDKKRDTAVAIEGYEKQQQPEKKESDSSVKAEVPTLKFKEVGKIDLSAINQKGIMENVPRPSKKKEKELKRQQQELLKPIQQAKKDDKPKQQQQQQQQHLKKQDKRPEQKQQKEAIAGLPKKEKRDFVEVANAPTPQKKEPEIFKYGVEESRFAKKIELKTTGEKIDLASLNQSTRPKKKSKAEKRRDREDRDRQANANKPKVAGSGNQAQGGGQGGGDKKKRKRIDARQKVVVAGDDKNVHTGAGNKGKAPIKRIKNEVSEEDVSKNIKETLARLTSKKDFKGGVKHRKDKRTANLERMEKAAEKERLEGSTLKLTEFVTASELAAMMDVQVNQVIMTCFNLGIPVSINQRLDAETINFVADEFGFKTEYVSADVVEAIQEEEEDKPEDLESRPPIVTVMGHVDHGKTSLLDYIRKANVIAGEAGGITQHIGAYHVTLDDGRRITFLDTPGHEAFTAMRARGAKATDIAIIIVAADDSVMPQTIEAINHASAAGVPIVFAINKIDKDGANPEKIKEALANMNYLVEDWGGKYQSQDISAKKGLNVKELLEKVLLESELLELKANPNRRAIGTIIESTLDKGRGYIATVLVSNGTLRVGDPVLAGAYHGKIKAMFNERNQRIKEVEPGEPALILGLNGAPQAGDNFKVMATEQEAREIAAKREQLQREQGMRTKKHLTLDELGRRIALGNFQELNVIVKGDVDGSVEALSDSLIKLSTPEIQVNVIHKAVGAISEGDVMLAAASNAIIIGFQVRPSGAVRKLAEKEEIDIRLYSIIYDAIEEIKEAMTGMLSPEIKEEVTATVEVREVFKITKVGNVAGCMVREGKIKRSDKVRLIRDGIVIFNGEIDALKREKDDVKEVATNYECGISLKNYQDIKIGDIIEGYEEKEVKKTL